jgi:hypothetical protein
MKSAELIAFIKEATIGTTLHFYVDEHSDDIAIAFPGQTPFLAFYDGAKSFAPLDEDGQAIDGVEFELTPGVDLAGTIAMLVHRAVGNTVTQ